MEGGSLCFDRDNSGHVRKREWRRVPVAYPRLTNDNATESFPCTFGRCGPILQWGKKPSRLTGHLQAGRHGERERFITFFSFLRQR